MDTAGLSAAESLSRNDVSDYAVAVNQEAAIVACGAYLTALLGYDPRELLGKHASLLFRNAYFYAELLRELSAGGSPLSGEVLLRHKHGGLVPAAYQAAFSGVNGHRLLLLHLSDSEPGLDLDARNQLFFPEPNPLPVLAITHDGILLCANQASWLIREHWKTEVGEGVPAEWARAVQRVLDSGEAEELEVQVGLKALQFTLSPVSQLGYVNLFGSDVTSRKQVEQKLLQDYQVFDNVSEAVVILDLDGRIVDVNRAFSEVTGHARGEVLGENVELLRAGLGERSPYRRMLRSLRRSSRWEGELSGKRRDGSRYPAWLSVSAVADEKGTVSRYVAIFRDISATKQTAEQLFHMAHFDNLTGLLNRQAFLDRLNRSLLHAERFAERLALLFIDLDGFKLINDNLGHGVGDRLLALLAARITDCVRQSDTVARIGGDEFTVILPMLKSSEDAALVAQKIIEHIAEPASRDGHELLITASVGIAIFPEDGSDAGGLLQNADTAMYLAKELGRSQYQFFSPEMNRQATEKLKLQNKLREAAGGSEITVFYQPQLEAASGELVGLEALARWNDPSQGMIGPDRFIPVAEETGLIHQIGRQVLLAACRQGRSWQEQGFKPLRIAINISAHQLRRPDFVSLVQSSLAESGLAPGLLELEITESSLIGEAFDIAAKLRLLKSLGVSITIDDFGMKYSSLSYLKRLPIDRLKIDRSFIREIPADSSSMEIASAIIAMARSLRLEVVAEGVESRQQAEFLKRKGCHYLQGFYYHHPLPPLSLAPILKEEETRRAASLVSGAPGLGVAARGDAGFPF